MSSFNDFNQTVITEFRGNGGKVGGPFANMPLLLLTTIGAKSGQPRIAPLVYITDGDHFIVIASKAGAPTNPDWYYNLVANPSVTIETGHERFQARAAIAEGQERERLYAQMGAQLPQFLEYQQKTSRQIPVVILKRIG
ncbi:MAG TPA: nitroreductase family deazaflavin-dependent oxidoreductase [Ktedonobacteraceae bacterium]|nr:nitroreductase family deazaflavin-dependent oxidoreductase [Ktedonobacteraceae bacterium]